MGAVVDAALISGGQWWCSSGGGGGALLYGLSIGINLLEQHTLEKGNMCKPQAACLVAKADDLRLVSSQRQGRQGTAVVCRAGKLQGAIATRNTIDSAQYFVY